MSETFPASASSGPLRHALVAALQFGTAVSSNNALPRSGLGGSPFMALMAMIQPDFRTIATLRGCPPLVGDLLLRVLNLRRAAGLTDIGSLSFDGTKFQASASVCRAMSHGRMRRQGHSKLVAEATAQVDRVKETDTAQTRDQTSDRVASGTARSSFSMCRIDVSLDALARRNVLPALRSARLTGHVAPASDVVEVIVGPRGPYAQLAGDRLPSVASKHGPIIVPPTMSPARKSVGELMLHSVSFYAQLRTQYM